MRKVVMAFKTAEGGQAVGVVVGCDTEVYETHSLWFAADEWPSRNSIIRHLLLRFVEDNTTFVSNAEIFRKDPAKLNRWALRPVDIKYARQLWGDAMVLACEATARKINVTEVLSDGKEES